MILLEPTGPPKSASRPLVFWSSVLATVGLLAGVRLLGLPEAAANRGILVVVFCAAVVMTAEACSGCLRPHSPEAAEQITWQPSWSRTLTKLLGLILTFASFALLYRVVPEYGEGLYQPFFDAVRVVALPAGIAAVPYFYVVDARMPQPQDGYWHLGRLVLLRRDGWNRSVIVQHLLAWTVKAFFLPLMFGILCRDVGGFAHASFGPEDFEQFFRSAYSTVFLIDVIWATVGYVCTFRLFGTHIRSVEPTLAGWVAALVCYPPLNWMVVDAWLPYSTGYEWTHWLRNQPVAMAAWGSAILALCAIYLWATVCLGPRFSNLTNRGIVTSGPYRWTKHPAYLTKNLSWWLISIPFLAPSGPSEALHKSLLLLCVNAIYWARAITEEKHLSVDPAYRQYERWIAQHGLFARVRRVLSSRSSRLLERPSIGLVLRARTRFLSNASGRRMRVGEHGEANER